MRTCIVCIERRHSFINKALDKVLMDLEFQQIQRDVYGVTSNRSPEEIKRQILPTLQTRDGLFVFVLDGGMEYASTR